MVYRCLHNDLYSIVRAEFAQVLLVHWNSVEQFYKITSVLGPSRRDLARRDFQYYYTNIYGIAQKWRKLVDHGSFRLPCKYQYSNGSIYRHTCK